MKSLNIQNQHKASQSGFTIIELVVVILLLGILAATALPRFIDVSDEAHDAVVRAVQGGLTTAGALYRAEWTAEGRGTNLPDGYPLVPVSSGSGYPLMISNTGCSNILDNMLQSGHPPVVAISDAVTNLADTGNLLLNATSQGSGFDTLPEISAAFLTASNQCIYVYTADLAAVDLDPSGSKYILFNATDGDTSRGILP